jgi:predicted outer membrane repeat protein
LFGTYGEKPQAGDGGDGGGIFDASRNGLSIQESMLRNNTTGDGGGASSAAAIPGQPGRGGGMHSEDSGSTLVNVAFTGNRTGAGGDGGGMSIQGDGPELVNAVFSGNFAGSQGGGIYCLDASPVLRNTTFGGNTAAGGAGGGMYSSGVAYPAVRNSIFWGNVGGQQIEWDSGAPDVRYSDVQGGTSGVGNIDEDPQFVRNPDPGDGDWATWGDNDYGDLRLRATSPAVDAGNNAAVPADSLDLDNDGNTGEQLPYDINKSWRIVGETVDMGASEAPRQVSLPLILRNH